MSDLVHFLFVKECNVIGNSNSMYFFLCVTFKKKYAVIFQGCKGNSEDEMAEEQEIGDEDSDDGSLNLVQSDSEDDGQVIQSYLLQLSR